MAHTSYAGKVNAPDFPQGLDWFNTDRPISLRDLRGRVVLLDFWTYCCINCMHVIPDLKKLEAKYPNELVVIGVHSAKFTAERDSAAIGEAIRRYGVEHPVVNDREFAIWNSYAVRAWPSFMLIDPEGKVVAGHSGENVFEALDEVIGALIAEFEARGALDRSPLAFGTGGGEDAGSGLSYPGKIAIDPAGHTLYVADSNHNRILIVSLPNERVVDVIGDGGAGLLDGSYEEARFKRPQGLLLDGNRLYVADTENHAIRRIDLRARTVTTIAGTGEQARERNVSGRNVALNSPWDLAMLDRMLYIAMAGWHQIWRLDPVTLEASPYAGSGREDIIDGPLLSAALAQPSGISAGDGMLYVADSEVSAVRSVDLDPAGDVRTIVGEGLFEFGDADGIGSVVRLQHPLGILQCGGLLYLADTYNNKIRMLNPAARRATTLVGSGRGGMKDGPADEAELNEPSGLAWGNGMLYIADTNNHAIRRYDFASGMLATLRIQGIPRVSALDGRAADNARPHEGLGLPMLAPESVSPGEGRILIALPLPPGHTLNSEAPITFEAHPLGDVEIISTEVRPDDPEYPLVVHARFGMGSVGIDLAVTAYYCTDEETGLCMMGETRAILPIHVREEAGGHDMTIGLSLVDAGKWSEVEQ